MARIIKMVKDKDGNELEIYSDTCIVCQTEMVFPKSKADEMEALIPFLKAKIEAGTPCAQCMQKQLAEGTFDTFTLDELKEIRIVGLKEMIKQFEQEGDVKALDRARKILEEYTN